MNYTLNEITKQGNCKLVRGDGSSSIKGVSHFMDARGDDIIFWIKPQKDLSFLAKTKAAAIMVAPKFVEQALQEAPQTCAILEGGKNLEESFIRIMQLYQPEPREQSAELVHASAVVAATAKVGKQVRLAAGSVIGEHSVIGDNCSIGANAVIAEDVEIGANSIIYAGAVIYSHVVLGKNVILHSGSVLGGDGFGFMKYNGIHNKIPHTAGVVIEDNVEIGSNSTVDRGAMSATRIGAGTKIDNLCQVGHSAVVGKNCILCTAANIGGSARVDDDCIFTGRSGCVDNVHIGKGTIVYVGGIAVSDTVAGAHIAGIYGKDNHQHLKELAALKRLAASRSGQKK